MDEPCYFISFVLLAFVTGAVSNVKEGALRIYVIYILRVNRQTKTEVRRSCVQL